MKFQRIFFELQLLFWQWVWIKLFRNNTHSYNHTVFYLSVQDLGYENLVYKSSVFQTIFSEKFLNNVGIKLKYTNTLKVLNSCCQTLFRNWQKQKKQKYGFQKPYHSGFKRKMLPASAHCYPLLVSDLSHAISFIFLTRLLILKKSIYSVHTLKNNCNNFKLQCIEKN